MVRSKTLLIAASSEGHFTRGIKGLLNIASSDIAFNLRLDVLYLNDELGDSLNFIKGNRFKIKHPLTKKFPDELRGYDNYLFESISPINSHYINSLNTPEKVYISITDDELARRWNYYQAIDSGKCDESTARSTFLFSEEIENAFENSLNFICPKTPWEFLLKYKRKSRYILHDYAFPYEFSENPGASIVKNTTEVDILKIFAGPKPMLPTEDYSQRINSILREFNDAEVAVDLICPKLSEQVLDLNLSNIPKFSNITALNTPIQPGVFFSLLNSSNGILIGNRGGIGTLLRACTLELPILYLESDLRSANFVHMRGLDIKIFSIKEFMSLRGTPTFWDHLIDNHNKINNLWSKSRKYLLRLLFY